MFGKTKKTEFCHDLFFEKRVGVFWSPSLFYGFIIALVDPLFCVPRWHFCFHFKHWRQNLGDMIVSLPLGVLSCLNLFPWPLPHSLVGN